MKGGQKTPGQGIRTLQPFAPLLWLIPMWCRNIVVVSGCAEASRAHTESYWDLLVDPVLPERGSIYREGHSSNWPANPTTRKSTDKTQTDLMGKRRIIDEKQHVHSIIPSPWSPCACNGRDCAVLLGGRISSVTAHQLENVLSVFTLIIMSK